MELYNYLQFNKISKYGLILEEMEENYLSNSRSHEAVSKSTTAESSPILYKSFKCKYCNKYLSCRQSLREHEYIHSGHKPYQCPEPGCQAQFRQGSQLSIHKRDHLTNSSKYNRCPPDRISGLTLPPITSLKTASKIPNIFTLIKPSF